jgi:hypothetical protein
MGRSADRIVMARGWLILGYSRQIVLPVVSFAERCIVVSPFLVAPPDLTKSKTRRRRRPNVMKVYLASWRHSAHTATNA